MTLLPIVERELRVAARRRSAFWTRLAAAAIAVAIAGGALWFQGDWSGGATVGSALFGALASVAFLFCLAAGPIFTADILSEEKRDGTLGLLFLTDLRGYDVVAGKLVAASVTATFSLVATLPVLAIPILLGGISLGQFGCVAAALGNALFFSLAAGALVSATTENARSAFALTIFLLFLAFVLLPWLADAGRSAGLSGPAIALFAGLSPSTAFFWAQSTIVAPGTPRFGTSFWATLATSHALAWIALALAAHVTARVWHEQVRTSRSQRWRSLWLNLNLGARTHRQYLRATLLARNPILWLGSRQQLKRTILWSFAALATAAWLLWRALAGGGTDTWGLTFFVAWFLQTPLKWLMASEASQRWASERQTGGLELLLTTPLTVPEILDGHWLAFRRLFGVPVALILGAEAVLLVSGLALNLQESEMAFLTLVSAIMFVWDLHTLAWVGLWLGLIKRRPNQAFLAAVTRVLVLPCVAFFVAFFILGDTGGWGGPLVLWILICGAFNLFHLRWARRHLAQSLREISTTRFAESK